MSRRVKSFIITNLKCEECDNIFNIPRNSGQIRSKGHTKHLWCYKCKKETAHYDFKNDYDVIGEFAINIEKENDFEFTQ